MLEKLNYLFWPSYFPMFRLSLFCQINFSTSFKCNNQTALLLTREYILHSFSHLYVFVNTSQVSVLCSGICAGICLFVSNQFPALALFRTFITENYISQIPWWSHFWVKLIRGRHLKKTGKKGKVKVFLPFLFFFSLKQSVTIPASPSCSLVQPVNLFHCGLIFYWRLWTLGFD